MMNQRLRRSTNQGADNQSADNHSAKAGREHTLILGISLSRAAPRRIPFGNSRFRDLWQPHVWLYLPAYAALFIALGAACRALAHFITNSDVALYLWSALLLHLAVSFGVQCGDKRLQRWAHRARIAMFLTVPVAALLFNASVLAPLDAEAEINASVALIVGWASIVCVLLIGSRYGDRKLPLAAPLVPGLSLFGLLNSLSVDTIIQICFLVFVAGSLYLVVYEPMLHRLEARDRLAPQNDRALRRPRMGAANRLPSRLQHLLSRAAISRTAIGYLAACSMWFAAFLGGAAIFYYPVEAVLPRVMAAPLGAVRGASAALLDWRGSSPVMELRGGNYPLSDRVVMRVELHLKRNVMQSSPVLWRGRVYEQYETSRWIEMERGDERLFKLRRGIETKIPPLFRERRTGHDALDQAKGIGGSASRKFVRQYEVQAFVQPERTTSSALYFPGELTSIQASWRQIQARANGTFGSDGFFQNNMPYGIRARVKEERLSGLQRAQPLSQRQMQAWRRDEDLSPTLSISPELRRQLSPIVAQIRSNILASRKGSEIGNPYIKAGAVRDYLVENCRYSLSAPLVPATDDAVVFFLTKSKRGACDMFASSMVLLLRAMNVPARLATGYIEPAELTDGRVTTGGSTIADNALNNVRMLTGNDAPTIVRNDAGQNVLAFAMREKDAHAWVEYFVKDAGWLTYDPTAGTRTTEIPIEDQIATMFHLPSLNLPWQSLWLPLCGVLLIGVGIGWSVVDSRARKTRVPQTTADLTRAEINAAYARAVRLLKRHVPAKPNLTPLEFEAEVNRAKISPAAKQEFTALTYLLMGARYTSQPPAMSSSELAACVRRLRRALGIL